MLPLGNWQTWGAELFVIALLLVIALMLAKTALATGNPSKRGWHYPQKWLYQERWHYLQRRRSLTPYQLLRFDQQQRPDSIDAGQQLNAVIAGSFEKRRVLSRSEYRVFAIVENEIKALREGYRVFAQTSLGQILKSNDDDAFRSINSKRVDILIIDRSGLPYLAVEYQGDGHYQGSAAARDAIKKEALRKAGVPYMEFCATDTDDRIRSRLREHLAS